MKESLEQIAKQVIELIEQEWIKQGHNMTGAFIEKMSFEIEEGANVTINILDNTERTYGKIINRGVPAQNIRYPYAPARIKGLTDFAKFRFGASDKDAVSIAYAIATKHKAEGMPLPSSSVHSQTGKRTGFVRDATLKTVTNIVRDQMMAIIKAQTRWR
jgi:hypothetical protein